MANPNTQTTTDANAAKIAFIQPNFYQLSGAHLHVTYLTHSGPATVEFPQGPPHFSYQDATQTLQFSGSQIEVVQTEAGQVVSVRIRLTVDSGSTTFSVLIPRVNLLPSQPAAIQTDGITAIHRFSLFPGSDHGQLDLYSVTPLYGTASRVLVPL